MVAFPEKNKSEKTVQIMIRNIYKLTNGFTCDRKNHSQENGKNEKKINSFTFK